MRKKIKHTKKTTKKSPTITYVVSVASYYEDNNELTSHCAAFFTPEEALDWFETDWNEQALMYGQGEELTKEMKADFISLLTGESGVAEVNSPSDWGVKFQWKGVREER